TVAVEDQQFHAATPEAEMETSAGRECLRGQRLASAQYRDIRNAEEQPTQAGQQGVTVGAYLGVIGIDQYRLEEGVHRLAQAGQLGQCLAVLTCSGQRLHSLVSLLDGGVQGELAGVVEVVRFDLGSDATFGLAQQV